jgi:diaminopimelate epimerase
MKLDIVIADPAGNITAFVPASQIPKNENPQTLKQSKIDIAKNILACKNLNTEQVGFFYPPSETENKTENKNKIETLWRLEMMGGEFCGNAARSFGLFCAQQCKLSGKHSIPISISGAEKPVIINVDVEENFAEVEIPPPVKIDVLLYEKKILPVCIFSGITHIIACDIPASEKIFYAIKKLAEKNIACGSVNQNDALGVMFYDTKKQFMQPAVYVYQTESLVFESSCASGSAAFAACKYKDILDCNETFLLRQRGGTIQVATKKISGKIESITIGGYVSISKPVYGVEI